MRRRRPETNEEVAALVASIVMDAACGDQFAVEKLSQMIRLPAGLWPAFASQMAARTAEIRRIAGLPSNN
jgi:hypothetical protein